MLTATCSDFCCASPFTYAAAYIVPDVVNTRVHVRPDTEWHVTVSAPPAESGSHRHWSPDRSTGYGNPRKVGLARPRRERRRRPLPHGGVRTPRERQVHVDAGEIEVRGS